MKRSWIVLLLAACASGPQWQKAGATPESVEADRKQCEAAAPFASVPTQSQAPAPGGKPGAIGGMNFSAGVDREAARMRKDEQSIAQCMRAKGYSGSSS
jgi:hypothetical protein